METDEIKTQHSDHNYQRYVWRKKIKGVTFDEKNILLIVKHEVGSIMLWGCVAAQETFHRQTEEWISVKICKLWKQM